MKGPIPHELDMVAPGASTRGDHAMVELETVAVLHPEDGPGSIRTRAPRPRPQGPSPPPPHRSRPPSRAASAESEGEGGPMSNKEHRRVLKPVRDPNLVRSHGLREYMGYMAK